MDSIWVEIILLLAPLAIVLPAAISFFRLSLYVKTTGLLAAILLILAHMQHPG